MKEVEALTPALARALDIVLTDIDDTLTTDGRLHAAVLLALERLQDEGMRIVPVTGRPAGWCDHIARMWPVDAVVGENGAFSMRYDRDARRMIVSFFTSEDDLRSNRARLDALGERILREVPGSALASDQDYRIADLAIDFCEDVDRLPLDAVERIVALFQAAGAEAKISSIHVNGWFGAYDKRSMAERLIAKDFGIPVGEQARRVAFVGDSPNDEPLFAAFPVSVGVANVADHLDRIAARPAYVTRARSGKGFIEFAEALIAARRGRKAALSAVG